MSQKKLEEDIDALELHEMSADEIERVVSSFSLEGLKLRKERKKIRYNLYRIKTETLGGPASKVSEEFKKRFERDPNFGGWRFFSITWDVALDNPYRCVHRDKSINEEWEDLIMAKFPVLEQSNNGVKLVYPDIKVRKKVEEEHSRLKNEEK